MRLLSSGALYNEALPSLSEVMHEAGIGHPLCGLIEWEALLVAGMLYEQEHGDDAPSTSRLMVDAGMHIPVGAGPAWHPAGA